MLRIYLAYFIALILISPTIRAGSIDWKAKGLVDIRAISSNKEKSSFDGGLGKVRYGSDQQGNREYTATIPEAALALNADYGWSWGGHLQLKYTPEQRTAVDITEAYIHYKTISDSGYRSNTKIGAFFPPISAENRSIAWSSPYTLSSSAINSWVGEELKTIGIESSLEKAIGDHKLGIFASFYKANDPAGLLLSYRGWALHDHELGLLDRLRVPDNTFFVKCY